MADQFSMHRLAKIVGEFKKTHGRDISESELVVAHFDTATLDHMVRRGLIDKYQVTNAKGAQENRFKIHRDWRSLSLI